MVLPNPSSPLIASRWPIFCEQSLPFRRGEEIALRLGPVILRRCGNGDFAYLSFRCENEISLRRERAFYFVAEMQFRFRAATQLRIYRQKPAGISYFQKCVFVCGGYVDPKSRPMITTKRPILEGTSAYFPVRNEIALRRGPPF